jgi:hypothetical protein
MKEIVYVGNVIVKNHVNIRIALGIVKKNANLKPDIQELNINVISIFIIANLSVS